ncbi:MAG: histidine triad nucleotide-binding protein [bacterium]
MDDCLFCKIAKGEIPTEFVYEDEHVVAFRDIKPVAPIHVLVIPRRHIVYVTDLSEKDGELLGKVYAAINKIAKSEGIAESGFRVVSNCKRDGQQMVLHLHFHIIGGRQMTWPPG